MINTNIYAHTLRPHKFQKLFKFRKSTFPALYQWEDHSLSELQCEYEICRYLWLLRFNEKDILAVMAMFYSKHSIRPNWKRLKQEIIPKTYLEIKPINQQRRAKEYQARKARKAGLGITRSA